MNSKIFCASCKKPLIQDKETGSCSLCGSDHFVEKWENYKKDSKRASRADAQAIGVFVLSIITIGIVAIVLLLIN